MGQPYVGEIKMFGGDFAPNGWLFCQGQLLAIADYNTLFQSIGTTYGGDGQSTFALPNLSGRVPVHQGNGPGLTNRVIGELGGTEAVTLTSQQIPQHTHAAVVSSSAGSTGVPSSSVTLGIADIDLHIIESPSVNMNTATIGNTGGSQPHNNLQPTLAINFIISLFGIFPSPS